VREIVTMEKSILLLALSRSEGKERRGYRVGFVTSELCSASAAATLCNYPARCGKSVRTFDSSPLRSGSPSSRFSLSRQSGIAYILAADMAARPITSTEARCSNPYHHPA
jgi:hypothetical protein